MSKALNKYFSSVFAVEKDEGSSSKTVSIQSEGAEHPKTYEGK